MFNPELVAGLELVPQLELRGDYGLHLTNMVNGLFDQPEGAHRFDHIEEIYLMMESGDAYKMAPYWLHDDYPIRPVGFNLFNGGGNQIGFNLIQFEGEPRDNASSIGKRLPGCWQYSVSFGIDQDTGLTILGGTVNRTIFKHQVYKGRQSVYAQPLPMMTKSLNRLLLHFQGNPHLSLC